MSSPMTNGSAPIAGLAKGPRPLALKMQQTIKTAVHQDLIKRMDLEKIAQMHDNPASQQQLVSVINS